MAMSASPKGLPARVLVVEDEAIVALDIKAELESMGHQVCGLADDVDSALALARNVRPDLALVDIRLKGSGDGIALAGVLREELQVPVVYLTSYSDDENVRRATKTMPYGYLTKPFQPKELRAAIAVALNNAAMERRLQASERRFRSAFDHAPLGMAMVSTADWRYLEMNGAMRRLLGVEGRPLNSLSHADLSVADELPLEHERLGHLLAGRMDSAQFEKRYRHLQRGDTLPTLVSVSLLPSDGGALSYLYQVLDLTLQKLVEAQQARLEAERTRAAAAELVIRARNEFLSRMSHELRTPLNAIMGFAQLLKMRGADGNEALYLDHILGAGEHLVALVDDVLSLQRSGAGKLAQRPARLSLRAAVERVVELLSPAAAERDVQLACEVPAELLVTADPVRLRQVLLNLGSNAVKYNRHGGSVAWTAGSLPGGRVQLVVRDTGCGIPPASMTRLFEPFERLGQQNGPTPGTGLGLLIARGLAEDMGATLALSSKLGQGTEVTIEFPAGGGEARAGETGACPPEA